MEKTYSLLCVYFACFFTMPPFFAAVSGMWLLQSVHPGEEYHKWLYDDAERVTEKELAAAGI